MNRRLFLGSLLAGAVFDPERLLWVKGAKLISIPELPRPAFSEDEWRQAISFCWGDQWPWDVKLVRLQAGRPVMVVNRIWGVLAHEEVRRKLTRESNYEGWRALIVETYRKYADQQRVFNLLVSNHVEAAGLDPTQLTRRSLPSFTAEAAAAEAAPAVIPGSPRSCP